MIVFVDTNVLLDLICQREGFQEDADHLFALCIEKKCEIAVSVLTLINTNYTAHKYGYSFDELADSFKALSKFIMISPIDAAIFLKALDSNPKDLEDAVQLFSAERISADFIVTRDKKGFAKSSIKVYNPKEFLAFYAAEQIKSGL